MRPRSQPRVSAITLAAAVTILLAPAAPAVAEPPTATGGPATVPFLVASTHPGHPVFDAGSDHTCAIKMDHTLWCWGSNHLGQLGDGTTNNHLTATRVGGDAGWKTVAAEFDGTCAIKMDHTLWCWGNRGGPLIPTQVGSAADWDTVVTSDGYTCGIKIDRSLWCWGYNASGQLGDGTTTDRLVPTRVTADTGWRTVTVSAFHTCGIKIDQSLWCWGSNEAEQLGISEGWSRTPARVGAGSTWSTVTAGVDRTCALMADRTAWCWGSTDLFDPAARIPILVEKPTRVDAAADWTVFAVGGEFGNMYGNRSCAIKVDGSLWCWGIDWHTTAPKRVDGPDPWREVTLGGFHTCGIKIDRSLWCWGDNSIGQFGDGTQVSQSQPVQVLVSGHRQP